MMRRFMRERFRTPEAYHKRVTELLEHNNAQLAENRAQRVRIKELEARIAELEARP